MAKAKTPAADIASFIASAAENGADLEAIQRQLKSDKLYAGRIDRDFGKGTGRGLLQEIEKNPALLKNASGWFIAKMNGLGYGDELRTLVAGNKDLKDDLIRSSREMLDKVPLEKMNNAQLSDLQTNLSLLGLYEKKIDGYIGPGTHNAAKALMTIPAPAPAANTPQAAPAKQQPAAAGTAAPSIAPTFAMMAAGSVLLNTPALTTSGLLNPSKAEDLYSSLGPLYQTPSQMTPQNSFGQMSLPGYGNDLLDLIRQTEANGNYNIANGRREVPFTEMSINEVLKWQKHDQKTNGKLSAAAGAYQFMPGTLKEIIKEMGLSGKELFNEAMQDTLAFFKVQKLGFEKFLEGDMNLGIFMHRLSSTWASLPRINGHSVHRGVSTNRALVEPQEVIATLKEEKQKYKSFVTLQEPSETRITSVAKEVLPEGGFQTVSLPALGPAFQAAHTSGGLMSSTAPVQNASDYGIMNLPNAQVPKGPTFIKT